MTIVNHIQNNGGDRMTNEKRPAEADRNDLQELTRRVEKLEKDNIMLLQEIAGIHQSDAELGKILIDLFQGIIDADFIERLP